MSEDITKKPYNPKPGSSFADIVRTERLGEQEDQDPAVQEQRTRQRRDNEMYKGMGSREEEMADLRREFTHTDRVDAGQVAEAYRELSPSEIRNKAYGSWRQSRHDGEMIPTPDFYSNFYKQVYPQYPRYLEQRTQQDPTVKVEVVLEDFLEGMDLPAKK